MQELSRFHDHQHAITNADFLFSTNSTFHQFLRLLPEQSQLQY